MRDLSRNLLFEAQRAKNEALAAWEAPTCRGAAILLKAFGYLSAASTDIVIGVFLVLIGLQKLLAGKCKCYELKK